MVLLVLSHIGKIVGDLQATWMGATDKRIKLLVSSIQLDIIIAHNHAHKSSVISQFLLVKWSGYENVFADKIEVLRRKETHEATRF